MPLQYDLQDPYRLWVCGNPFSSHTEVEDALDHVQALIQGLVDPEELVVVEGRHSHDGSPLLEFTLDGETLLCVLYGATWQDWEKHGPEPVKAN